MATLFVAIPLLTQRWGILGAAYADCLAVGLLTLTLSATAWVATRQFGFAILKASVVPVLSAVGSGYLAFVLTSSIQSDVFRFSIAVCLIAIGYLLIVAVLGGRGGLIDLANVMRLVVRRSSVPAASQV